MKLIILTKELREAVAKLSGIPGASGGISYTQSVKLEAGMAGLTLSRITGEARIAVTAEQVEIEDDSGTPKVDHGSLSALLSRLTGEEIKLVSDDQKINFTCGTVKAALSVFGEESEFAIPETKGESITLPVQELSKLLSIPLPAVSRNAARPQLEGVCLRMMEERLAFLGTDGKRCHIAFLEAQMPVDCLLPLPAVECLLRAVRDEEGDGKLTIGPNTAHLSTNTVEATFALLAEKFPNMDIALQNASSFLTKMTISREKLIEAMQAGATVAEGDAKAVRFTVEKDELLIVATNNRDSEINVTIPCQASTPATFACASAQLATALELLTPDENGNIELLQYPGMLYVRQPDWIVFVALQRTQ